MTISSETNRTVTATNGVTTIFSFPYYFLLDQDLVVLKTLISDNTVTTLMLSSDYTVTGAANPAGGSVTISPALATGYKITVYRDPTATQELDLVANDEFPAEATEKAFDKGMMILQRLKELIVSRTFRLSDGDVSGASLTAPTPEADTYLGWAPDGLSLVNRTISALGTLVKAISSEAVAGTNDTAYMTPAMTKAEMQGATFDTGQTSTDATATEGPTHEFYRNSASPAVADLTGVLSWAMKSSTAVKRVAAKILGRIVDPVNATEDFALDIYTIIAGALARRFSFGAGLYANGLTDMGAGTVNAVGLYVNGSAAGKLVNFYSATYSANADLTTAIPLDDSAPTITEGTQILTLDAVTTSATQKTLLNFSGFIGTPANVSGTIAIFAGNTCIQVATGPQTGFGAVGSWFAGLIAVHTPGSATTTTYSVRVGASGTVRMNGTNTARQFGGAALSIVTAAVIEP